MSVCEVLSRHSLKLRAREREKVFRLSVEWKERELGWVSCVWQEETRVSIWSDKWRKRTKRTFWFFAGSHPFLLSSSPRHPHPLSITSHPSSISSLLVSLVKNRQMSTFPLEWIDGSSSRTHSIPASHQFYPLHVFHFGIFLSLYFFIPFFFSWFIWKMVRAWYDAICTCVIYGLCLFRDPFQLLLFPSLLLSLSFFVLSSSLALIIIMKKEKKREENDQ